MNNPRQLAATKIDFSENDWKEPFTSEELREIDAAFAAATAKATNITLSTLKPFPSDDTREINSAFEEAAAATNISPSTLRPFPSDDIREIDTAFKGAEATNINPSILKCPNKTSTDNTVGHARPKTGRHFPNANEFCNGQIGLRRQPGSFKLTGRRFNSTSRRAKGKMSVKNQAMKFGGRIIYCRTKGEVEAATLHILNALQAKKRLHSQPVFGLDIEWRPTFKKGVPPGKAAVMQICGDMTHCYVLHIFHSGIPHNLRSLLEHSSSIKVGVGIGNDATKLFRDHNVSITSVQDLSALANQKLGKALKSWSLSSLVETLTSKRLLKPSKIRLGNWEAKVLSPAQLQYAATDAFASWHLYEVLKSLPDPLEESEGNPST